MTPRTSFNTSVAAVVIVATALLACKKLQGSDDESGAPAASAAATPSQQDLLELDAMKLDQEVVAAVKTATSCEMNNSIAYKCEEFKQAKEKLKEIAKNDPRVPAVFETLAALPFNQDEKVKQVAPYFIRESNGMYIFPKLEKHKDAVSKATAHRLLKTFGEVNDDLAPGLAEPVVKAATLAGVFEPTYAALEAARSEDAKRNGIKVLMTYGRMNVFEKVEAYAKNENAKIRQAALDAPRSMSKWTDDEAKQICPWAEPFLRDADLAVAGSAAHDMVKCKQLDGGKYVKAMLAEGKRRVEAGEWKKPFVWAYRDICFGGFIGTDKAAPGDLCDKTYEFLEWVANQEKVDAWHRGFALSMIYYQRRDQKTYDMLKKYQNSPVKEIRESVADDMKSLEEHYLNK